MDYPVTEFIGTALVVWLLFNLLFDGLSYIRRRMR